jgi:negative regulator of flagellin synthesis FlgM
VQEISRSGIMPPIEVGPARAISAINARIARKAGGEALPGANGVAASQAPGKEKQAIAGASLETSEALDPGAAPVDSERVQMIRKAVETGKYPLVPAKIADAMIAAGVLLRSSKS